MNRPIKIAVCILFAVIMYLILAEAVAPWVNLPDVGNVGFTMVFVLFALTHCLAIEGLRFTAQFFAVSAFVSFWMEEIGVRTGLIFGFYHYSDSLGVKVGHVPVLIPLAWFMMIYPSWRVGLALLRGIDTRSLSGLTALAAFSALVMTGWDAVMDPGMSIVHNWVWEHGGAYFGVPRKNYIGWLLTTFLIYCLAGLSRRNLKRQLNTTTTFISLPVIVYSFFAFRYVLSNRFPALQVVALFSMAMPGWLALLLIYSNNKCGLVVDAIADM